MAGGDIARVVRLVPWHVDHLVFSLQTKFPAKTRYSTWLYREA